MTEKGWGVDMRDAVAIVRDDDAAEAAELIVF